MTMPTMILRVAGGLLATLCIQLTLAAPLPPVGRHTITGEVSRATWIPEKKMKGDPGFSGSAGVDRVFPAHYLVEMQHVDGLSSASAAMIKQFIGPHKELSSTASVVLMLPHTDRNFLKNGMRIRVVNYTLTGDEGGTWAKFDKIEVVRKTR